jgi:hypothetical protein
MAELNTSAWHTPENGLCEFTPNMNRPKKNPYSTRNQALTQLHIHYCSTDIHATETLQAA